MEHLQVILENNNTIKEFAGYYRETVDDKVRVTSSSIKLVGGAIIDILRGKTPKDYDFLDWNDADIKRFVKAGFVYLHETRTATTYKRGDIINKAEQLIKLCEQSLFHCKHETNHPLHYHLLFVLFSFSV